MDDSFLWTGLPIGKKEGSMNSISDAKGVNTHYEDAVLGALLIDSSRIGEVEDILRGDEFVVPLNKLIFDSIKEMSASGIPVDIFTVGDLIASRGIVSPDMMPHMGVLVQNAPSSKNIVFHAKLLSKHAHARSRAGDYAKMSSDLAVAASELAFNPSIDSDDTLDEIERRLIEIKDSKQKNDTLRHVKEVAQESLADLEARMEGAGMPSGILTGFSDLDEQLNGLHPGDLVIVAGRPAMGKTAFSVNIGENMAMQGAVGAIISLEMPGKQLTARMCSSLGRIPADSLRRGRLSDDDLERLSLACSHIEQMKLYIDDRSDASLSDVRSVCRKVKLKEGKIDFLIIDYLQLMNEPLQKRGSNNRNEEISAISRGLKKLAKDMGIPVIALSQLNRGLESRQDKRPIMSDLRESGAIEQDADVIMFVYRDEVYNPDTSDVGAAEIIIGKQRNGPIGTVRLRFDGMYSKFSDGKTGF